MKEFLSHQSPHFVLWMPFLFAFGAALYFALPFEPNIPYPIPMTAVCAIISMIIIRKRRDMDVRLFAGVMIPLTLALGFIYTVSYTRTLARNTITYDIRDKPITGVVSKIDYTDTKTRIFMQGVIVDDKTDNPINVRISLDPGMITPDIGTTISAHASLFKPEPADVPGGFDFAEWMYFQDLAATGFLHDDPVVVMARQTPHNIHDLRTGIHNRVARHGNDTALSLSDSLILGFKNAMPREDADYAKAAGIAHVFSISGFHITLVGGWLFAIFYLLFRMIPAIGRNIPARVPAMMCAWVGLLIYLGLSGADVATIRAFLMATLAFVAFFTHRTVFSLRTICIVFGLLIMINPHYVAEAGFQLSFAAIFGLVFFFDKTTYKKRGFVRKALHILLVIILTDLVATLFTAPFVAYHFGYMPLYSLLGNLLCLPIFSFIIMPLVLIGTITATAGFYLPLDMAAWAYDITVMITKFIYHLPFAQIQIPTIPGYALFILVIGFLCGMFLITSRRIKIYVIAMIGTAFVAIVLWTPKPVFYASADHELVAFLTDDGTLQFNKRKSSNHRFTFESWNRVNMTQTIDETKRRTIGGGFDGNTYAVTCTDKVCYYKTPDFTIAYVQRFVPLYRNIDKICDGGIKYLIAYFNINAPNCHAEILNGGLVIYQSGRVKFTPADRIWHQ